jgi:hypothetical protein
MKKLLLSCLLLASGYSAMAQASCAAAANITLASTTITTGAINGTYSNPCYGGTNNNTGTVALKAKWWKYTPAVNGEITVSSDIAANAGGLNGVDSRLSILTGADCTSLTCVDRNDDVNGSADAALANYRSTLTVPVQANTTYWIEWDSYWKATSFQFTFNFVASPCIRLGNGDFYLPDTYTGTDANLYWNQALGAPAAYDVDWSINYTDAAGTGTIVNVDAGALPYVQATVSGLPDASNFRYYVRANCGTTQSAWVGPRYGYLAVPLPYANDFELAENNYTDGFVGDFSVANSDATATPPINGDGDTGRFLFSFNNTTATDSDDWGFSRALNLTAGEEVTFSFKTRAYAFDPDLPTEMTFDVTVGTDQVAANHTVLNSFSEVDDSMYTDRNTTFTVPADGIYYFGIHNNTPGGAATSTALFVDTLNITSVLSNNSFISSKLSVYPNPATNVVNISSTVNATINAVEMTDLNGRVVMTKAVNATNGQIAIGDLATGVYMMKITTNQGTAIKKIVKQ